MTVFPNLFPWRCTRASSRKGKDRPLILTAIDFNGEVWKKRTHEACQEPVLNVTQAHTVASARGSGRRVECWLSRRLILYPATGTETRTRPHVLNWIGGWTTLGAKEEVSAV